MFVLTWIISRVGLPRAVLCPKLLSSYICQDLEKRCWFLLIWFDFSYFNFRAMVSSLASQRVKSSWRLSFSISIQILGGTYSVASDEPRLLWQPFLKTRSPVLRVTIEAWSNLCIESFIAVHPTFVNRLQPGACRISIQEEAVYLAVSSEDIWSFWI